MHCIQVFEYYLKFEYFFEQPFPLSSQTGVVVLFYLSILSLLKFAILY